MSQADDTAFLAALEAWMLSRGFQRAVAPPAPIPAPTPPPPIPGPTPVPVPVPPTPVPSPSPFAVVFEQKTLAALTQLEAATPASKDEFTFSTSPPMDRFYYDTPAALWQMWVRTGDDRYKSRALKESAAYRASLIFSQDRRYAWIDQSVPSIGAAPWKTDGSVLLDPAALRRMYVQGQVMEYVTLGPTAGAPAKEAALALANTLLASLPFLTAGKSPVIDKTERNLAFALLGLAWAARLDPARYSIAMMQLSSRALSWNARSTSGGFDHDLAVHDAAECEAGFGGSPFMSTLLVEALRSAHVVSPDTRIPTAVKRVSEWLMRPESLTKDGRSYQYLVGCQSSPEYSVDWKEDLNAMIVGTHGWAAMLNPGDAARHLAFADKMAAIGLEAYWARKSPKHFGQDVRGMIPYLAAKEGRMVL